MGMTYTLLLGCQMKTWIESYLPVLQRCVNNIILLHESLCITGK